MQESTSISSEGGQFPLNDLPQEIIDLIIDFILGLPGRIDSDRYTARELFSHPIIDTCKQLRQIALNILATRCIWVRFSVPNEMSLDREKGYRMRNLVSQSYSFSRIYNVFWNDIELPGTEPLHNYSVIFPFSAQECFRILSYLGTELRVRDKSKIHFNISRKVDSVSLRQTLDSYILQPLQHYYLPHPAGLKVEDEELGFPPPSSRHAIWDLTNAVGLIDRLRRCLEHAKSFRQSDRVPESALVILHTEDLVHRATEALAVIYSLSARMITRAHLLLPLQNDLATLIFDARVQAGSGLYSLYKIKGTEFLRHNEYLVKNAILLTMTDLENSTLPPVEPRQRASMNYMSAVTHLIQVDTRRLFAPARLEFMYEAREDLVNCARLAAEIWPEMPELAWVDDLCRGHDSGTIPLVDYGEDIEKE